MKVRAGRQFLDKQEHKVRLLGEEFEVTPERAKQLQEYCAVVQSKRRNTKPVKGPKIIYYHNFLYQIGGIETMNINVSKMFPEADVTFLYGNARIEPLELISYNWNCEKFNRYKEYECDILILANYVFAKEVIERVKAKKIYQFIHSDYESFKWEKFELQPDVKLVAVSEQTKIGIKKALGYDSVVCENPLLPMEEPIVFLTLSRPSTEKGFDRMIKMMEELDRQGIDYLWLIATEIEKAVESLISEVTVKQLKNNSRVMFLPACYNSKRLITKTDYVVQLSDSESFCYSAYESLASGTPVIVTDFPQAFKFCKDGENGYILKRDLSNLEDVVKKLHNIPKKFDRPIIKTKWGQLLKGEL